MAGEDVEFEELKGSLFEEVKYVQSELQKFEDLFRQSGYAFQSSDEKKPKVYPERVYLIENGWW